jgi:signal transduction histidine kinase
MRRTVSVVQHVVRNVTARVRSWARRIDAWMLVAAAIAVPLLAALQYRWLSDLAAAQHMAWRQRQAEAVARGAAAINDDFSSFYAATVEIARAPLDSRGSLGAGTSDTAALDRVASRWKNEATTLGRFARIYAHDPRVRQWVPLAGSPDGGDDRPIVPRSAIDSGLPFSASWLLPDGERTLPAMHVWLDGSTPGVDQLLLTVASSACLQLLRAIANRFFDDPKNVRLAIDGPRETQVLCADSGFDLRQRDVARAPLFRLRPPRLPFGLLTGDQRAVGVAMSGVQTTSWNLHAQDTSGLPTFGALGLHTRNLWTAAGLELTLVVAIIAVAMAARRERRTAAAHVTLSAIVAHELRTPLAAIKVLAQNQARGVIRSQPQIEQYGATIAGEADRLHLFVERVLQFTGNRATQGIATDEDVDFERVLVHALQPLEGRIAAGGITLQSNIDSAARLTRGDETALVLAVRNLVQNALDHGVGARRIVVGVYRHKRHAVVSVSDDGAGVAESARAGLFEPFVRGSGAHRGGVGGHGIGLAIVRDVARAHGGRAWYDRLDSGARFAFSVLVRSTESV